MRLAATRNAITRNESTGIHLPAPTGALGAVIRDNTIYRNYVNGGIYATGAGVSVVIDANAISGSGHGISQVSGASVKTRSNNTIENNDTDMTGTLTPVDGH